MAILKTATIEQAEECLKQGTFVYNNPCCSCGKQCSTPTLDIWNRRVKEFGGVRQMYEQYKCRDCRKSEKPQKEVAYRKKKQQEPPPPATVKQEPQQQEDVSVPVQKKVAVIPAPAAPHSQPVPGEHLTPPSENAIGIRVWDQGKYVGTSWHKIA